MRRFDIQFLILTTIFFAASKCDKRYEFIVVGSGAGGGVVASRLAQANKTVALLEAGPDDAEYTCTNCGLFNALPNWPKGAAVLLNFTAQAVMDNNLRWPEWTQEAHIRDRPWNDVPQIEPFIKQGVPSLKSSQLLRGRVLGGCTAHNFMMYCRGSRNYYNSLKTNYGLDSWDYKHMLPFLKKLETFPVQLQNEFHGSDGPIEVECSDIRSNPDVVWAQYVQSAYELGLPVSKDLYGFQMGATGPACRTITTKNTSGLFNSHKKRSSIPETYIRPTLNSHKSFLEVKTDTEVTKIIFNTTWCRRRRLGRRSRSKSKAKLNSRSKSKSKSKSKDQLSECTPKAIGVSVKRKDRTGEDKIYLKEGGEIIVSGGHMSPKILMASRVGPKEKLSKWLRIPKSQIIADIPGIGSNVRDHVGTFMSWEFSEKALADPVRYLGIPSADLASIGDVDTWLFPSTVSHISAGDSDTDSVLICGVTSVSLVQWFLDDIIYGTGKFPDGTDRPAVMWVCLASAYRTRSIGRVELNKTDPIHGYPEYFMNFFDEEVDIVQIEEAIRLSRKVNGKLVEKGVLKQERWPGLGLVNDAKSLREYVMNYTLHVFHTVGSVSMGKGDQFPLNEKCALKGVKGVRVADGSNYPDVPDCNSYIPIVALGEKCAHHILEDH